MKTNNQEKLDSSKHTPTPHNVPIPLKQDEDGLYTAGGNFIASFKNGEGDLFRMATPGMRKFLVNAANSNEVLVEALKRLLKFNEELCEDIKISKQYPSADFARKAIAQAEGK